MRSGALLISLKFSKIDQSSIYYPIKSNSQGQLQERFVRTSTSISNNQAPEAEVMNVSSSSSATQN